MIYEGVSSSTKRHRRNHAGLLACVIGLGLTIPASAQEQQRFSYDALGRLTKVERGSGPDLAETAYTFDKAGNRTRVQVVAAPARLENGSFETPHLASYAYAPSAPNLQFTNMAGIAVQGDLWNFAAPWHGRQVAFLQSNDGVVGAVTMVAANLTIGRTYQFSFAVTRRPGYPPNTIRVLVNGTLVQSVEPTSDQNFGPLATPAFVATAPTATVRFETTPTFYDSSAGLDAVGIQRLN